MIRFLVRFFYTQELLFCFGPICLALLLISAYFIVLLWLRRHPSIHPAQVERYRSLAGQAVFTLVVMSFLFVPACGLFRFTVIHSLARSQTFADRVILVQAIEDFEKRTGRYPDTLDELVPVELSQVPMLPDGTSYGYGAGNDWYSLSYVLPGISPVICSYGSGSLGWYCD
jgi:hypothetical protein